MAQRTHDPAKSYALDVRVDERQHPIGTLAIVGVYGALFALGWLVVYFFIYVPRGAVTP
jgi:hypothetical protein